MFRATVPADTWQTISWKKLEHKRLCLQNVWSVTIFLHSALDLMPRAYTSHKKKTDLQVNSTLATLKIFCSGFIRIQLTGIQ